MNTLLTKKSMSNGESNKTNKTQLPKQAAIKERNNVVGLGLVLEI